MLTPERDFAEPWDEIRGSLISQLVKNPPAMQETLVQFLGWKDLLEKIYPGLSWI